MPKYGVVVQELKLCGLECGLVVWNVSKSKVLSSHAEILLRVARRPTDPAPDARRSRSFARRLNGYV